MELRITTLIENVQDDKCELLYEHGLSLYIEFDGKKILFDTGQSGDFVQNAKTLGTPLEDIDAVIISHGHYDHSGGLKSLLPHLNKGVRIYVGNEFFNPKYKVIGENEKKYIGTSFTEEEATENGNELVKVKADVTYITDEIMIFKNFSSNNKYERLNRKFILPEQGNIVDRFPDELALGLATERGLVVVLGCSHIGVVNILEGITKNVDMPIYAVLGGTHLVEADEERINWTIDRLRAMDIQYIAVSHCTGELGKQMMKEAFGEQFILNNTGNVFEV